MRFTNVQFAHGEEITVSIRNQNAANAIVDGQPVFYINQSIIAASNVSTAGSAFLGIDVTTPSDIAAAQVSNWSLFAGIAKIAKNIGFPPSTTNPYLQGPAQLYVGDVGEACVYGFTDAIITMRTRLTSTDSWASVAAFSAGDLLIPETIGNALSRVSTLPTGVSTTGAGSAITAPLQYALPPVVAGQSVASIQSNVSTFGAATLLADTYRMKVFVRAM